MVAYVADTYLYIRMYKYIVVCRRKRTNALYTREDSFPAKAERKDGFMDEESRIERHLRVSVKKMGGMDHIRIFRETTLEKREKLFTMKESYVNLKTGLFQWES